MKGKIAFVLGAAVGYVLGSRAGRARYEQIKRGAETLWNTEPVQKGVGAVREAIDDRADEVKAFIRRASSDAFSNIARQTAPKPAASKPASANPAATPKRTPSPEAAAAAAAAEDEAEKGEKADS